MWGTSGETDVVGRSSDLFGVAQGHHAELHRCPWDRNALEPTLGGGTLLFESASAGLAGEVWRESNWEMFNRVWHATQEECSSGHGEAEPGRAN